MGGFIRNTVLLIKKNYLLSFLVLVIGIVMAVSVYKLYIAKPTYIYVKVKVGQGLWWASTQRPSMWFVKAIRETKENVDLSGRPLAKVLSVTYYPYYSTGQYDVYAVVRLKVSKTGSSGKYNFDRSTVGVGSPIDLEFSTVQFSGTIIQLSNKPINSSYVEKIVTLDKKNAFPWEYDAITADDSYFNGETDSLRIIDKQSSDTYTLTGDVYGNYPATDNELRRYIRVKVKLKGHIENGQFIYADDQAIIPGRSASLSTPNFVFTDFMVAKVE